MAQFEPYKEKLQNLGTEVIFVAAEKASGIFKPVKFLTKHPISFPFLLDEDRGVTKAYGLYHRLGMDAINIAHPATLIIDRQGIVRYIYRGDNQNDRVAVEEVMESLESIVGRK